MRLFLLARHGQSELNVSRRINGDPTVAVQLTPVGEDESRGLGLEVANVALDLCIHTRFGRTRATAEIALSGRSVPFAAEPLFDDIDVGDLEGQTIEDYRAWKHSHTRDQPFPDGESLNQAAHRYAAALERLLGRPERRILVICHEIPIRYALNGAAGSDSLDAPAHEIGNCVLHLFDEAGIERAIAGIESLAPPSQAAGERSAAGS